MAQDKPSVTLFRGWTPSNTYVWSPFVIKVEARLRFAGLPYNLDTGSPRTSPRGKIPYLAVVAPGGDLREISDSTLMISDLVEDGTLPDLNRGLSPGGRAHDLAMRALMEDKLYFYNTYERWTQNYYVMRDHALGAIPYPMRVLVGLLAYRGITHTLHGQGTSRFTADEIASFRLEIWNAVNDLLVESKSKQNPRASRSRTPFWVLGAEQPTEADCVVFGFVVSSLISTAGPQAKSVVQGLPTVVEYARRIHDRYFPDYEVWPQ